MHRLGALDINPRLRPFQVRLDLLVPTCLGNLGPLNEGSLFVHRQWSLIGKQNNPQPTVSWPNRPTLASRAFSVRYSEKQEITEDFLWYSVRF